MTKVILFLIRKKLGLKKNEIFQFDNQKNKEDYYYISENKLYKIMWRNCKVTEKKSNVSLNWLLDPQCKIVKIK